LTPSKFFVKFPPHRSVSDIKNLPSFNLRKDGVQVGVLEWIVDLDHLSELKEVWIQIEGSPPKWCAWKVFAQMASGFGLMLERWTGLLYSCHSMKKLQSKLPAGTHSKFHLRSYLKLYLVAITIDDIVKGLMMQWQMSLVGSAPA
jgi:hypothetical protein